MRLLICTAQLIVAILAIAQSLDVALAEQAPYGCSDHFLDGELPAFDQPSSETHLMCFSEFAVLHSGTTKTPLWSAEHLTSDRVADARSGGPRPTNFHAEASLPLGQQRAKVRDYKSASDEFDIGHMSPSGDMTTRESRRESFSLANTVPQHACNNEELWEGLERAVRDLAVMEDEIFVVTGPIYPPDMAAARQIGDGVVVPREIFKAIYSPSRGEGAAYIAANEDSRELRVITLDGLRSLTGMSVFPMEITGGRDAMTLPPPKPPQFRCRLRPSRKP